MPMFRQRALQRISSPEQLDRMVQVTLPRRWIALAALLVVVSGAVVWSVVSTVPTTLKGPGYLLPLSGLREVQAPTGGTVRDLELQVGQHVVAQQVIGSIDDGSGRMVPVRAPGTGTVSESDVSSSNVVNAGDRIGLVEPVGWPVVLYGYVSTNLAAALPPGTPVQVSFGAGIGSSYGYAKGHVQSVSQFATTSQRLDFILQDSSLVDGVRALGPTNEVVVALDQSASTPSGLAWGSGDGPPAPLPAGLPASLTFVVGSHHPIDDVL